MREGEYYREYIALGQFFVSRLAAFCFASIFHEKMSNGNIYITFDMPSFP